jgi:hypothetical protein
MELYLHSSDTSSWRGVQLNTGITLPSRFLCRVSIAEPSECELHAFRRTAEPGLNNRHVK